VGKLTRGGHWAGGKTTRGGGFLKQNGSTSVVVFLWSLHLLLHTLSIPSKWGLCSGKASFPSLLLLLYYLLCFFSGVLACEGRVCASCLLFVVVVAGGD